MNFFLGTTEIDLGNTTFENIFIDDFMPMANGTAVKVYLLGYKFAHSKENKSISNQTIAKHLRTSLDDVLKAWDFWEEKGIIKKHFTNVENDNDYSVEFINLKQLYIDKIIKPAQTETSKKNYTCTPTDIVELNSSPAINNMFNNISGIIGRTLVPNEYKKVLEWLYNYNMSTDVIIRAFEFAKEKRSIKNINYVQGILKNWFDNGLTNIDNLNVHMEYNYSRYNLFNLIKQAIGYKGSFSTSIKDIINKWVDEWNFSNEVILLACEETLKISQPNFKYLDGILSRWYKSNLKTTEAVKENKKQFSANQQSKTYSRSNNKNSKEQFQTKFHNFKHTTTKYTDHELEEKLNKNLQKKLKNKGLNNLYNKKSENV
ncbi:DnaD domain protein [Clostridiaceae bacterium M8S5]|nr:DnaD domain protein [Clostridiaceae bacterium M8S5]